MALGQTNIAIAINQGGGQVGGEYGARPHHHHHHCHEKDGPEKPDRNPFLDFLTAPLQATGLKGGNQNDKQYDKYLQANEAGNALKGF